MATAFLTAGAAGSPAVGSTPAAAVDYHGTPLETSDELQNAPSVTSGVYVVDAPAEGETGYFEIPRTIDGSNIWVGATADLGPDAPGSVLDGGGDLRVSGFADGAVSDACWGLGSSVHTDTPDGRDSPRLATTLWQTNREPVCKAAATIVVAVSSFDWTPPPDTLVQLTVWEEPPATDTAGLQTPSKLVSWGDLGAPGEPVEVEPGASWSDAPDISSGGTYAFHLDPGTVAVFRMRLDWGEHGQVLISTKERIRDYEAVAAYWAGPQGGAVTQPELQNAPPDADGFSFELEDGPATAAIATPVVNWRDRQLERGTFGLDQTGMPGTYYFVVHLKKDGSKGADFTFQSGYFSDYAVAPPNYEPDPPAIPEVATFEEDDVDKTDSSSADPDGDGDVPWPIVLMLFGGGAIFAVIGVVALNRSRRGRP